jgi:hypothetical protein
MIADKFRWIWKWHGNFLGCILLVSLPLLNGCDGTIDIDFGDGNSIEVDLEDVGEKNADLGKNSNNSVIGKKWIVNLLEVSRGQ